MNGIADVVEPDTPVHIPLGIVVCRPEPDRTPGQAVGQALSAYPSMQLWSELREMLSTESASLMYEAAATAYRESQN